MQNDISLEQIQNDTKMRQEQLEKMKKNIEALQLNMMKKKIIGKSISQTKPEPISIYNYKIQSESSVKSPIYYQNADRQFGYNSNLFKNIGNDSQPIMENGSAVSNFSSVSNINNILNNHNHKVDNNNSSNSSPVRDNDKLLQNIDKVLQKVQNSHKLPNKAFQKLLVSKQEKQSRSIEPNQSLTLSKMANSGQLSARTKLQEYKLLINKLDTIHQQSKPQLNTNRLSAQNNFSNQIEPNYKKYAKTFQPSELYLQQQEQQSRYKMHKKNEPSNFTIKSQYPASDNYGKFPPTPPTIPKMPPKNAIERQKALIKQSVQQYKKMESAFPNEILDKSDVDFELSDQQDQKSKQKQRLKQKLFKQRQQLKKQLKGIQEEIRRLQND